MSDPHQPPPLPAQPQRRWFYSTPVVILSLFFCFPIGLILMWVGRVWSQTARIVVTVLLGVVFVASLVRSPSAPRTASAPTGAATAAQQAPAAVQRQEPTVPKAKFISDSCSAMSRTFGPGSKLSDLQKEELWKKYKGQAFQWDLEITEVSSGVFGGYTVQAKCAQDSPSLIQDIQISYSGDAKNLVMQLQKGSAYTLKGVLTNTSTLFGMGADGSL